MKKRIFEIPTNADKMVQGELDGNENSDKAIIFCHGFGVKRDALGLFDAISKDLEEDYLIIKFDFVDVLDDGSTFVPGLLEQVEKLQTLYKYFKHEFNLQEINIIAHSFGCLIAGIANLENISRIVLLAGSPTNPIERLQAHFGNRQGSVISETTMSKALRSDGSITFISPQFWSDLKQIQSPFKLYSNLAKNSDTIYIRAALDKVDLEPEYQKLKKIDGLKYLEVKSNHNFEGEARPLIASKVAKCFYC